MKKLLLYTRNVISEDEYSPRVAYSMHLALEDKKTKVFVPLNHNSGVLFATATDNEDGSMNAKCLLAPSAVETEPGKYVVFYVRTDHEGDPDKESKGSIFYCETENFYNYSEPKEWKLSDSFIERIRLTKAKTGFDIFFVSYGGYFYKAHTERIGGVISHIERVDSFCETKKEMSIQAEEYIKGFVYSDCIEIDDKISNMLLCKLTTPINTANTVPKKIKASCPEDILNTKAIATYSDGSECVKPVDWDISGIDFSKKQSITVKGKVAQKHFAFPLLENRADPDVFKWKEKYYFIATTDEDGNHTTYVRESDTIEGLFTAEPVCILDSKTYDYIGGLLWAPEFHEIDGRLYIFMAATKGEFFCEESRLLTLKEGGSPINPADWSEPVRIVKKDGSELCKEGEVISLDMTCFEWEGEIYVVWSQRQFLPVDQGAWLYIAKLNREKPWMLATDPVVLKKPEYSFENNHTYVVEGPFALIRGDKLYLTYSGAAVDATYVVSMMTIEKGKDLLNKDNWKKMNYPLLCARSTPGEYGTGHNAYVEGDDGLIYNTYHARPGISGPRSTGIRRVHFGFDGDPILDMHEEEDLVPEIAEVTMKVKLLLPK